MILKGNQRSGAIDLVTHLLNAFDNETVEVAEISGSISDDPLGAFSETEALASATNCTQPFYSLSINPPEPITREQYFIAIDRVAATLGLEGQARRVFFHRKNGREHAHVVWSRIKLPELKAINISHDRFKLKALARELAAEFGLKLPPGLSGGPKQTPDTTLAEKAQAEASGMTPEQRRHDITEAYLASDTGTAFKNALSHLGYTLAQGDRRGFVVVDRYGHVHSLTRQIDGVCTKHITAKLSPLDPQYLPTVDQVLQSIQDPAPPAQTAKLLTELKAIQFKRRASFHADKAALSQRQAQEFQFLQMAQQAELETPAANLFDRFPTFYRYPLFRSVFAHLRRRKKLRLQHHHALEREALVRRHNREWLELTRRERLLRLLDAREKRALETLMLRKSRDHQRFHGKAARAFFAAAMTPTAPVDEGTDTRSPDPELAALELKYSSNYQPIHRLFNKAAGIDTHEDDGGEGDDTPHPDDPTSSHHNRK